MSYDNTKQFVDGETLVAAELNQLIEGINGSVTNIALGEDNVTLTITKNDGSSFTITLPSGGGDIDASEIVLDGLTSSQTTWTADDKIAACNTIGALKKTNGTGVYRVYATDTGGTQQMLRCNSDGNPGSTDTTIALRQVGTGQIRVPKDPTNDQDATSKAYVDGLVGNISTLLDNILDLTTTEGGAE